MFIFFQEELKLPTTSSFCPWEWECCDTVSNPGQTVPQRTMSPTFWRSPYGFNSISTVLTEKRTVILPQGWSLGKVLMQNSYFCQAVFVL